MSNKTLYLKFILAYFIFGILGFIAISTFIPDLVRDQLIKDKANHMYAEASLIANSYATELYNNEVGLMEVKKQLHALSTYMDVDIQIINPSGRLILDTQEDFDVDEEIFIENFDPTITRKSYYTIDNFFDYYSKELLTVFASITSEFMVKGYVVIHYDINELGPSVNNLISVSYFTLAILFMLSLIVLIFFTELVYTPLRKIIRGTEQYAAGNMEYEIKVDSDDELGYLAACLNFMANQIANYDNDQKKFIANVSHDFRSPLTSIRGFLEAMLDGTIPPEMHEKYLGIVLNETERLTKLTNDLLALNNLSTKGMRLEKTDFDINSVIRAIAASFENTCRKKKLAIEIVLTGETFFVNADLGKIQQVIYNLTDNAIKFSHQNSVIKIETFEKKNKLFVSVKDSGIGIPKEEIKQIWDRFYKSDLSRGKDKKGTGLGLSIVKEIIKAHGEKIDVISTEGVGSEFIFSLSPSGLVREEKDNDKK